LKITTGLEPASFAPEVSVTITTEIQNNPPGNTRKETDSVASALRNLMLRDYAPAPQSKHIRQGLQPCAPFFGEEVTLPFHHRRITYKKSLAGEQTKREAGPRRPGFFDREVSLLFTTGDNLQTHLSRHPPGANSADTT